MDLAIGDEAQADDGAGVVDGARDEGRGLADDLARPPARGILGPDAGNGTVGRRDVLAVVAERDRIGSEPGDMRQGHALPAVAVLIPDAGRTRLLPIENPLILRPSRVIPQANEAVSSGSTPRPRMPGPASQTNAWFRSATATPSGAGLAARPTTRPLSLTAAGKVAV